MEKYGGYAPYRRALEHHNKISAVPIDVPLAGQLEEGRHLVTITTVETAVSWFDLYLAAPTGTHRERIFRSSDSDLRAAVGDWPTPFALAGRSFWATLAWGAGYRVLRNSDGTYVADVGGTRSDPFPHLSALQEWAARAGHKRSYLRVVKFEPKAS